MHENIRAYTDIGEACDPDIQLVLLVIPTQFLRKFLVANLASLPVGCPIVVCAKVSRSVCIVGSNANYECFSQLFTHISCFRELKSALQKHPTK